MTFSSSVVRTPAKISETPERFDIYINPNGLTRHETVQLRDLLNDALSYKVDQASLYALRNQIEKRIREYHANG